MFHLRTVVVPNGFITPNTRGYYVPLGGLRYSGGKHVDSRRSIGRQIASLLPYRSVYVEPFAGQLGVLLQRQPSKYELINDLDSNIYYWWKAIREFPCDLFDLVSMSPFSREMFIESGVILYERSSPSQKVDKDFILRKALSVYIILTQSFIPSLEKVDSTEWSFTARRVKEKRSREWFMSLSKRLEGVVLENTDAVELLHKITTTKCLRSQNLEDVVVYVDPPYPSTTCHYSQGIDTFALVEALKAQKGFCAVSGVGDEWDCLGWERHEFREEKISQAFALETGEHATMVEVLWTNMPTSLRHCQIDMFKR